MKNNPAMSHNACYASPFSNRAVPKGFNLERCRYRVYVEAHSDVTKCRVYFYQYHGMYWYCLQTVQRHCFLSSFNNSVPFFSMRNATADCSALLRSLQFVNDTPRNLRQLVRIDQTERAYVDAELNKPTTKWI